MINYVKGDILQSKAEMIAHYVAPNDNFGQGLALSLREQWLAMYKDFRHFCQVSQPKSGDIWVWAGASGTRIAALLTQEAAHGHREKPDKSNLPHVNHSLHAMRQEIEKEGITDVALPKLPTDGT